MVKFQSLGLIKPVVESVKFLGFKKPTDIQKKIIPLLLQSKDVIACAKTGSGKTMAYLLPLVSKLQSKREIFGARLLILVPTRELALQTAQALKKVIRFTNLTYSLILGGHDYVGQFESLSSNPDIIISSPGRLIELLKQTEFTLQRIEYLVIDEADQFFEKDYREQLLQIVELVNKERQTVLLSATIPDSIKEFAQVGMREYIFTKLDSEYALNENLQMHFFQVKTIDKISLLMNLLQKILKAKEQVIVFTGTRYWVDFLEYVMTEVFNIQGSFLYGKMDQEARNLQLDAFRNKENNILIVTDLCARGIDIPNVENIVNFDFPTHMKIFIHRCGRTARAGKSGVAYSFFTPSERPYIYEIEKKIDKEIENISQPLDEFDPNTIYYGSVDTNLLEEFNSRLNKSRQKDDEFLKFEKRAFNSMEKFNKTRFSWSKEAFEKSKDNLDIQQHPFFLTNKTQKEFIAQLSNFKPQQSYFELKGLKDHPKAKEIQNSINKLKKKVIKKIKKDEVELKRQEEQKEENEVRQNMFKIKFNKPLEQKNYRSSMFISYEADPEKEKQLKDMNKINQEDLETYLLADENEDLLKHQKTIWDRKKKKYKKVLVDARGQQLDQDHIKKSREHQRMNNLKKKFKTWKKSNQIQIQREGTQLDLNQAKKFAGMFKDRKRQNFKVSKKNSKFSTQKFQSKSVGQLVKGKQEQNKMHKINLARKKKKIFKNKKGPRRK